MQSHPCFKLTHYIFKATEKKVSQRSMALRFCGIGANRSSENGFVPSRALWAGKQGTADSNGGTPLPQCELLNLKEKVV